MLPFLAKKSQNSGLIVKERQPDNAQDDAGMHAAAQDLMDAFKANDVKRVAAALQAAFEIADSKPHEEGEHINPHSYDSQNQKAGLE